MEIRTKVARMRAPARMVPMRLPATLELPPRRELMPGDASGLAIATRARSDHEIIAAGPDRLDQAGDACRVVGAVTVHEHHDVGALGHHRRHEARPAIAAASFDHLRAR